MTESVATTTGGKREIHLREHWRVVWQRRWVVATVFLLVVGSVGLYSFLAPPVYEAIATIEVQPQARRLAPGQDVSGIGAGSYGWLAEEKYQNTQVEIIRSRAVAERAFETLGLKNDPRFVQAKDPIGVLRSMIRVVPRRETGLIEVSMRGRNPDDAARCVNVISDTFVGRNLQSAKDNASQALQSITSMMIPLRGRLTDVEEKRFDVLRETESYSPETQQEIVRQRLTKLNEGLNATRLDASRLKTLLDKIQQILDGQGDPMSIPELTKDVVLQRLGTDKVGLERDFEAVKVTYRPGAPAYQEAESKLEKVKQRIRDQVALHLGGIRNEYELAVGNERSIRAAIQAAEQQAFQAGVATSKYDVARTDSATAKAMYDVIAKAMNEVSVNAQLVANNITVLDHAIPPIYPVSPNKKMNLILGILTGLFLGTATAFFLDYLDNTFHLPEDIERDLQLNTLAIVPRFDPELAGSAVLKEAYQTLRTALIFLSKNRERKVVLLTSTAPQEGKSSTTAELGRALASAGDKVLLVDCDLRRPTQHVHLGLTRDHGLTDFLAAPQPFMNWRAYLKTTGSDNLKVLTCGPVPPNPPELLGSDRFKRFLAEARDDYDWVLLDSPPAASLADASLLGGLADVVLLVIRHNHTDRDLVRRTLQQLLRVGANVAGVILNNVDFDRAYGKEYAYAGYYYTEDGKDTRRGKGKTPAKRVGTGTGTDVSAGTGNGTAAGAGIDARSRGGGKTRLPWRWP
jgi:capsular exopolysaccharide synthesis family protein